MAADVDDLHFSTDQGSGGVLDDLSFGRIVTAWVPTRWMLRQLINVAR